MVFVIVPDTNIVMDWRLIFNKIQPRLSKEFKNVFKINYNNLEIEENESGKFKITRYIYRLKEDHGLYFLTKKEFHSNKKDFDFLMKEILMPMDGVDSLCIINKSVYLKINKFMERRLEITEYITRDRIKFHYINTGIETKGNKMEKSYEISSLHLPNGRF